jgi:hypothetical protein
LTGGGFFDILGREKQRRVRAAAFWPQAEKVMKGAWRMPRLSEAMKDAISCEKLRGSAHTNRSGDIRMGQPGWLKTSHPLAGANPGN